MKTWTNPEVEELEVKLTALFNWYDFAEYDQNGKFEPGLIVGDPNAGDGNGNGNGDNQGGDEGSDEGFGTES